MILLIEKFKSIMKIPWAFAVTSAAGQCSKPNKFILTGTSSEV